MDIVVEAIGWAGAAAILAGYFLFTIGRIRNGVRYQLINLVGSLALLVNAWVNMAWPFVVLNAVWSATAVFALVHFARKSRNRGSSAGSAI